MAEKSNLIDSHERGIGNLARDAVFDTALAEVRSYRRLPVNWDSYGGLPASEQAAGFCESLLEELKHQPEVVPPVVRPISTGVYLEWLRGRDKLYFEVDEDSVLTVQTAGDQLVSDTEDVAFDVHAACRIIREFWTA